MFGFFRAARVAAALTMLVAFVAPAAAAEAGDIAAPALEAASQFTPQASVAAGQFTTQPPTSASPFQPQGAGVVAAQPAVVEAAPAPTPPQQARPLRDLVIGFVNYRNQDEEQMCLAKAVYFEARSESLEGQLAVAEVVLNRAGSGRYPPTICDVVTQPAQFSFILRGGRFPTVDEDSSAWQTALAIAEIATKKLAQQVAPNVLWYHATYVAPSWGRRLTRFAQIGTHIFYS